VEAGDAELVETLLDAGAKPLAFYANTSLLTRAARLAKPSQELEFVKVVHLLVDAGADPCAMDVEGDFVRVRASMIADSRGRSDLAAVLAESEQGCTSG
jgi:ankyrin repeat protein